MAKKDEFEFNVKSKREKKEKPEKPIKEKEPKVGLSDDGDFNFDKQIKREKAKKEPKERKLKDDEGSFEIGDSKKSKKPTKEPKEKQIKLSDDDVSLEKEKKEKKPFSHYLNTFLWGKNYANLDKEEKKKKWYRPTLIIFGIAFAIAVIILAILIIASFKEPVDPITDMTIISYPEKTIYFVGEEASYYGLKINVTYSDGTSEIIDYTQCEFSGFDNTVPTVYNTIFATYKNHKVVFGFEILENPELIHPSKGEFTEITIKELPKTEYKVGEWISVEGGVLTKHYSDGYTEDIPLEHSHLRVDFNTNTPGTYTIRVLYFEDGNPGTASYTITVTE